MTSPRDIAAIAAFAALIAVLGLVPPIPIGFLPVPITLQTLGVMLAGAYLGPVRGAAAAGLFAALVLVGLPLLSGGRGGIGVLFGPTAGFFIGFLPGALVTGLLAHALDRPGTGRFSRMAGIFGAAVIGGIACVYLCGIAWLWAVFGIALPAAALGMLPFLPGDLAKAAVTAFVVAEIGRVYAPAGGSRSRG